MLGPLSTGPAGTGAAGLSETDRASLVALFCRMRSGHGFVNDLRPAPDVTADVRQPTLVIASPQDAAVPYAHARSLAAAAIQHAELVTSQAGSHFFWYACGGLGAWSRSRSRSTSTTRRCGGSAAGGFDEGAEQLGRVSL